MKHVSELVCEQEALVLGSGVGLVAAGSVLARELAAVGRSVCGPSDLSGCLVRRRGCLRLRVVAAS